MNVPTKDTNPKDLIAGNKIPLWLLSPIAKAHWALAQFAGMVKYGAWNWRVSGVRASVYVSAMGRHLDAYLSGEQVDPVDGTWHLGNIMACAAILLDADEAGKLTEDRPPVVDHRPAYAELEALMVRLREQYADKTPKHYSMAPPLPDVSGRSAYERAADARYGADVARRFAEPGGDDADPCSGGAEPHDTEPPPPTLRSKRPGHRGRK